MTKNQLDVRMTTERNAKKPMPSLGDIHDKMYRLYQYFGDGLRYSEIIPLIKDVFSDKYDLGNDRAKQVLNNMLQHRYIVKFGVENSKNAKYLPNEKYNPKSDSYNPPPQPKETPMKLEISDKKHRLGNLCAAIWINSAAKYAIFDMGKIIGYARTLEDFEWITQGHKDRIIRYDGEKLDDLVEVEVLTSLLTYVSDDLINVKSEIIEKVLKYLESADHGIIDAMNYQPILINAIRTLIGMDKQKPELPF